MSGTAQQTAATITRKSRGKRPRWQRALIAAVAALLLLGGGKLLDEAFSRLAPQLLGALPGWLNALRGWPLWAQALLILGLGLLVFGAAWLILADRQQQQAEATEQTEQEHAAQGRLLDTHVAQPIVEALKDLQHLPTLVTPANVSAPSGLPRAVAFVGREQTLKGLQADLRAGGTDLSCRGGLDCLRRPARRGGSGRGLDPCGPRARRRRRGRPA